MRRCRMALAGLLVALAVQATPSWGADPKQEAKKHFDNGVDLFKNNDFSGALVEFKAAYKIQPHFAVRYNIGITLYKLNRYGDAHLELSAYLAEGGDDIPEDRKQEVDEILLKLQSLLGTLKVTTNAKDAQLFIDGEPAANWVMKLEVGEHEVEVRVKGQDPYKKTIELPGGESLVVKAEFEIPETAKAPEEKMRPEKRPRKGLAPAAMWSFVGITAAFAAATAVTGGLALKTNKDYQDLTYEDRSWKSVEERGLRLTIATDVLLGLACASAATTILLAIFTDHGKKSGEVAWAVAPSGQGLALGVSMRY